MRLQRDFFKKGAEQVAKDLLGKKLVRILPSGEKIEGVITETEAYIGPHDLASHAAGGRRTKRTEVMYGKPGRVYVYITYGIHWMLNIVTSEENDPQAVLIRSLDKIEGPARLTKYLQIDGSFYGEDLVTSKVLYIENSKSKYKEDKIITSPRIGIDYAGEWKDKLLRFKIDQ